jgi:hypothetical protein
MTKLLDHPRARGAARLLPLAAVAMIGCAEDGLAPAAREPAVALSQVGERPATWGQRGRIVSATLLHTYTRAEAAATLLARNPGPGALEAFDTVYNVAQYAISYTTVNAFGESTVASAAVFVPDTTGLSLPMVSFSHGTQTDKQKVPSTPAFINPQGVINATHGSITVLADYLGTGVDANHIVSYLVADAEANASLDALRAARRLVRSLGLALDGRLFIYGYSEGGSVSMALAREIESDPRSGFRVTAVAPMAGLYALYLTGRELLFAPPVVPGATGVVFFLSSFQAVYHVAPTLSDLLIPPYDSLGEVLITTGMPDADAQRLMGGRHPQAVMTQAAIDAWKYDPDSPLSQALRANATYEWVPRAPMRLYYGTNDVTVSPRNTIIADSVMRELGATTVEVMPLPGLSHSQAQWPAYISARRWFDSFPVPAEAAVDGDDADDAGTALFALRAQPR